MTRSRDVVVSLAIASLTVFVASALVYAEVVTPEFPKGTYVLTNIDDRRLSQFGTVVLVETSVVDMFSDNIVVFANISGAPGVAIVTSDRGYPKLVALVAGNLTPPALVALLERSKYVHFNGEVAGVITRNSISMDVENQIRAVLGLSPAKKISDAIVEGAAFSAKYVLPPTLAVATVIGILVTRGDRASPEATKTEE